MIHNPFKMQVDVLDAIRPEMNDEDFAWAIAYTWFSFDDLTHDGYIVADYVNDITEAVDEYGDVLVITEADEFRQAVVDKDIPLDYDLDDVDGLLNFMRNVAKAVDTIYEQYGPVFINTKLLEGPIIQFDTLDDESHEFNMDKYRVAYCMST